VAKTKAGPALRLKQVAPTEWVFEGPELRERDMDRFHAAIELLEQDPASSIPRLRALLDAYPDDIDVRHHLAIALDVEGDEDGAMEQWTEAVGLGLAAFPRELCFGRDRLEWGWLQNRPFLRAYLGLATALLEHGLIGEAVVILNNILDLNPNDNQGVRNILVSCWFALRRPGEVLRLSDRYPDSDPDLMFGRALAHLQLGQKEKAEKALRAAASAWPLVHKELLKSRHPQPKSRFPGYITVGGEDQAYAYWSEYKEHWKGTRGALALAKRITVGKD
jgi:tetratricopeptide (TPR) repeat protein